MNGAYASALVMVAITLFFVAMALHIHYQDKHPKPPASKAPPR